MEKSHVAIENKVCPVCCKTHTHECGILLDTRLRNTLNQTEVTGYGLCKEHADLYEKGFIALIVADEDKSKVTNGHSKLEDIYRTGEVIHLRNTVIKELFDIQVTGPIMIINEELANDIKKMSEQE